MPKPGAATPEPCPLGLAFLAYVLICAVIVAAAIQLANVARPYKLPPAGLSSGAAP